MKVVGSSAPSKARMNSIDEGVAKRSFMMPDEGMVNRSSSNSSFLTDEAMGGQQRSSFSGRGISSNAYANGASQNVGNVITDRPTSRVTQPPGGRSTISFG
jgi:hypothetical protein